MFLRQVRRRGLDCGQADRQAGQGLQVPARQWEVPAQRTKGLEVWVGKGRTRRLA
jgi:hypothetical protein